jgi:tetratricopeptide (TPR) repeat protein
MVAYLQDHPDDLEGRQLLAQVYEAAGDTASAALHYSKVLESVVEGAANQPVAAELYRKVKDLAPASPLVAKLAKTFEPPSHSAAKATSAVPLKSDASPVPSAQATSPPPDCDTHYALGVAYKNMGLFLEAMEELEVALQSSQFFVDASLMLALCLKERAQPTKAITYLERVLTSPQCNGQKASTIRYELGLLYEAAGEVERALHTFEPIPTFHDVRYRLESLRARAHAA